MIITNVIGGLGNQMFQYAMGRALALRRQDLFYIRNSEFDGYALHNGFELERVFTCQINKASEVDISGILGWQRFPYIYKHLLSHSMSRFRDQGFIVEPHFHYWDGINNVPLNSYLTGYWQSEKYFTDFSEQIRSDFTFKEPLIGVNLALSKNISEVDSVSLHVRRGDYANNSKTYATHGLCSVEYYLAAINKISTQINNPVYFIFSDDMRWVKNNLKINQSCIYVENNQALESYNDMRLMSLCKHHIIANSSFSWWGAWLNSRRGKIVIGPKNWFSRQRNCSDLLPKSWLAL